MKDFVETAVSDADKLINHHREASGWIKAPMFAGPLHQGLALLVSCLFDTSANEQSREQLARTLIHQQDQDGSFPYYPGIPASRDITNISVLALKKFLAIANSDNPGTEDAVQRSIAAAEDYLSKAKKKGRGNKIYRNIAKVCRVIGDPNGNNKVFKFPYYASLTLFFLHSALFKPLRGRMSDAVLELMPSFGILMQHGSRGSLLTRLLRFVTDRFGLFYGIEKKFEKLEQAILQSQNPNGCWTWTVLATCINLMALKVLGHDASFGPVRKGLAYIQSLQFSDGRGYVQQSWAGARVWDTAILGDMLVTSEEKISEELLSLAKLILGQQQSDGLFVFDLA